MDDEMSGLFTFLENFDTATIIRILDESDEQIYEGEAGDVPQRISNMLTVVKGTVINANGIIIIKVKKYMDLGVVNTIKFLEQFDNGGSGDYTKEKYDLPDIDLTREDILDLFK